MKIYLGTDHRGFALKEEIKIWLAENKIEGEDLGNDKFDPEDDFPDYAAAVAEKVRSGEGKGIVICGSGGMALVANKFPGIRAVECWNELTAKHAKEHDDANILMLPADFVTEELAKKIIKIWLETKVLVDNKHQRRLNKIKEIERRNL
jgi:ribose 5-phosphate isomerase B